jgi:amidophosphoribosyltransferase
MPKNYEPATTTFDLDLLRDGRPTDECGISGTFAPNGFAALLSYLNNLRLQHRGQESFGVASGPLGENFHITTFREMGRIATVMSIEEARRFRPQDDAAIAQNRYATGARKGMRDGMQPFVPEQSNALFALAHNGHLYEKRLHDLAEEYGVMPIGSDSKVLTELFGAATEKLGHLEPAIHELAPKLNDMTDYIPEQRRASAFNLTFLTEEGVIGLRDDHGVRPLWMGTAHEIGAQAISSEQSGLNAIDAISDHEFLAGTYAVINKHGRRIERWAPADLKTCLFELIYLSKPGNVINGTLVEDYRMNAGAMLAEKAKKLGIWPDMAIPVLGSGEFYAKGLSAALGVPYTEGLEKNPNRENPDDRIFIMPQSEIDVAVRQKFRANRLLVNGKRAVVADDSIVRGKTAPIIVEMLREAGAAEVHLMIGAPKYVDICRLGLDVQNKEQLLAFGRTEEEMRKFTGADTLTFLTLEEAIRAARWNPDLTCAGCMGGSYPSCSHHNNSDSLIAA